MAPAPDNPSMEFKLGEMSGQLRELIHSVNNMASKQDAMAGELAKTTSLIPDVADLKTRVDTLEKWRDRQDGAVSFGTAMVKAIPWSLAAGVATAIGAGALKVLGAF